MSPGFWEVTSSPEPSRVTTEQAHNELCPYQEDVSRTWSQLFFCRLYFKRELTTVLESFEYEREPGAARTKICVIGSPYFDVIGSSAVSNKSRCRNCSENISPRELVSIKSLAKACKKCWQASRQHTVPKVFQSARVDRRNKNQQAWQKTKNSVLYITT